MEFKELSEDFLAFNGAEGYENDINNFEKYCLKWIDKNETYLDFLERLTTTDLINSLKEYIERASISSNDTAFRYASVVKEFLLYALENEVIRNNKLSKEFAHKTYNEKSYRSRINRFINKSSQLKESKKFLIIGDEDMKTLIESCDFILSDLEIYNKAKENERYYNKYRSALMIKLIFFTGVKYSKLHVIESNQMILDKRKMKLGSYYLQLPFSLLQQLRKYNDLNIAIHGEQINERKHFFVNVNGEPVSKKTTILATFLVGLTGRSDLNGLIKKSIVSMINVGVEEYIIREITGVNNTIYEPCLDYVLSSRKDEISDQLSKKLKCTEIFDLL